MAKQVLNNGETHGVIRGKANDNFNELYNSRDSHLADDVTQGNPHGIDAKANKVLENIIVPTLINGFARSDSGNQNVGYYKDNFGIVHLEGSIASAVSGTNVVIFTLPVNYRPTTNIFFYSNVRNSATMKSIRISSNGEVSIAGDYTAFVSLSLADISFRV